MSKESINSIVKSGNHSAYEKHKQNLDEEKAKQELEAAQSEWDQIENIVPTSHFSMPSNTPLVTFEEVLDYIANKDLSEYMDLIQPVRKRKGIFSIFSWLIGPPKLNSHLVKERNMIFALAHCPFSNQDDIHLKSLQTIYKVLTGFEQDCPRYGHHWETIGFQGSDPATDLRGVGILALIQLLYLLLHPQAKDLVSDMYQMSHHQTQNFPFCIMAINITRITLEVTRDELLSKACNSRKKMFEVFNDFYVGSFFHLYTIWKVQKKTIVDSGFVLRDVATYAKNNVNAILNEWKNYPRLREKLGKPQDDKLEFSNLNNIEISNSSAL